MYDGMCNNIADNMEDTFVINRGSSSGGYNEGTVQDQLQSSDTAKYDEMCIRYCLAKQNPDT